MTVTLHWLDWAIIGTYVAFSLLVGVWMRGRASQSIDEYFLSGRSLPWWIAGTSMVATSFAVDTPLLVSGWVRDFGIWKNWAWWCQAISGVATVFLFARWWRRGGLMTKAELTELRYGGAEAGVLRFFLGLLHSTVVNTMVLCWVLLAAIKILGVLLGLDRVTSVALACSISLCYSFLSGFWGVVITDLFQFVLATCGAIALAFVAWNVAGGTPAILEAQQSGLFTAGNLRFFPPPGPGSWWQISYWTNPLLTTVIYLCIGWWALETVDGGGHSIQRICASRDERQGMLATLWYTVAHYAIRPWPWLAVGIASLVVLPRVEVSAPVSGVVTQLPTLSELGDPRGTAAITIQPEQGPSVRVSLDPGQQADWQAEKMLVAETEFVESGQVLARSDPEKAYIVMLNRYLPAGLKGIVVASLLAAFMSTVDTHVNLASSFFVNDIYRRFLVPDASAGHFVFVARLASVVVMLMSGLMAYTFDSISDIFLFFLSFLAGVGPVYVLRWLWWRVSARTEMVALVVSAATATLLTQWEYDWQLGPLSNAGTLDPVARTLIVALVSIVACGVSLVVFPTRDPASLLPFYRVVRPIGWWAPVRRLAPEVESSDSFVVPLVGTLSGIVLIYASLYGVGCWLLRLPGGFVALAALMLGVGGVAWALRNLEHEPAPNGGDRSSHGNHDSDRTATLSG